MHFTLSFWPARLTLNNHSPCRFGECFLASSFGQLGRTTDVKQPKQEVNAGSNTQKSKHQTDLNEWSRPCVHIHIDNLNISSSEGNNHEDDAEDYEDEASMAVRIRAEEQARMKVIWVVIQMLLNPNIIQPT